MTNQLTTTPIAVRSELLSYSEHVFEVYEAARPSNRVRVVELNEYRAIRAAGVHLGIRADKLRAHPAPGGLRSLSIA